MVIRICVSFREYTYRKVDKILAAEKWNNRSELIDELIQIGLKYREKDKNA